MWSKYHIEISGDYKSHSYQRDASLKPNRKMTYAQRNESFMQIEAD